MFNYWRKRTKPPICAVKRGQFAWVLGLSDHNDMPFEICRWTGSRWVNNYGDVVFILKWKRLKRGR